MKFTKICHENLELYGTITANLAETETYLETGEINNIAVMPNFLQFQLPFIHFPFPLCSKEHSIWSLQVLR